MVENDVGNQGQKQLFAKVVVYVVCLGIKMWLQPPCGVGHSFWSEIWAPSSWQPWGS